VGIGFEVGDPRHLAEGERIGGGRLVGRQLDGVGAAGPGPGRRRFAGPEPVGDPPEVTELLDRPSGREPTGDLEDRPLPHPKGDEIGLRVEQDRPANRVAPVVVVGDPAERGLHPAGHQRHAGKCLPRPLTIGEGRPVRPPADLAIGRVGVVVADLPIGGVVVDHRVHVARRDPEEESRPAEGPPGLAAPPVRLGEHRNTKPRRLEQPGEQPIGEARVIDVGVACHEHHVDLVPPPGEHLLAGHRQGGRAPGRG
jgi:hypothetical protein